MKKITLLAGALLFTAFSFAQITLNNNDGDTTVTGTNAVGCGSDNNWGRNFTLSEFSVPDGDQGIFSGSFGIQSLNGGEVTVNVYAGPAFFDEFDLTLLGSQTVEVESDFVAPGALEFDFDAPISIPAGTEAIFMEVVDPGDAMFIGGAAGNTEGKESWIKSETCAVPDYVTANSIGFPDAQFFLTLTVDELLSVNDNLADAVSVSPNPATDVLNISVPGNVELENVSLFDVLGKNTGVRIENGQLNIADLATGVYILNIETNAGSLTTKVVKK